MSTEMPSLIPDAGQHLVDGEQSDAGKLEDELQFLHSQAQWSTRPDTYEVVIDSHGRGRIAASTQAALNRAATVLAAQPSVPEGMSLHLQDTGRVNHRAVLECFYGERWTPEDRSHVIRETAAFGANTYIYGPSADRRTGGLWRLPYEGQEREQIRTLAADARGQGMTPIWRVSPAAPLEPDCAIRLADDADIRTLLIKIENTLSAGFEKVLIAFDDITAGVDEESARRFADSRHPLAEAHATIINHIVREVGAERVLACPTHYWGTEPSSYRFTFGDVLHPAVPVCWTGPSVISDAITTQDARRVSEDLGHRLWIWDNYPVNDWDLEGITVRPLDTREGLDNLVKPRRVPLAALTDRDADLGDVVDGYGTNMALGAHYGLPAAQTAVDYAWLGESYDSRASWQQATARSGSNPGALDVIANFAGPGSGSCDKAPSLFARACAKVLASEDPSDPVVLAELDREVENNLSALVELRSTPTALVRELHPWLMELGRQCLLARLASASLSGATGASELSKDLTEALAQPSTVSMGSGMGRALGEYARGLVAGGTPDLVFADGDGDG